MYRARSSAVERFSDKEEVEGPTPSAPTKIPKKNFLFNFWRKSRESDFVPP